MARIAAVAVIVRGAGRCNTSLKGIQIQQSQILLIERAVVERDRYSGHVAYPGGRAQPSEHPLKDAIRETLEEVGLELTNKDHFQLIGRLTPVNRHGLAVYPFVFEQICATTPKLTLQESEVKAAFWIPIEYLSNAEVGWDRYSIASVILPVSWRLSLSRFAKNYLPVCCTNLAEQVLSLPSIKLPSIDGEPPRYLWGMSLQILGDLFRIMSLPRYGELNPLRLRLITSMYEKFSSWGH